MLPKWKYIFFLQQPLTIKYMLFESIFPKKEKLNGDSKIIFPER